MIHILDGQTDTLLGFLDGNGEKVFWDDVIEQDVEGLNILQFKMLSSTEEALHMKDLNRLLVPHERGGWQEFVIHETEIDADFLYIYAVGSESALNGRKVIEPTTHSGFTLKQYIALATTGTEWTAGYVEYEGIQTLTYDTHLLPYEFLKRVETAFKVELVFHVEITANRVSGRYVNAVTRSGNNMGKEFLNKKDLIGVTKKIYNDRIVTGLFCMAPQKDDGSRLTKLITDEDAFQRWNYKGLHILDLYEPESDNDDMTMDRLTTLGNTALKKRIDSVVEYTINAADLGPVLKHETTYLGDTVRIKDTDFNPPLYAEARIINVKRPIKRFNEAAPVEKTYIIGEVVEFKEEDVLKTFRTLQVKYGAKIIRNDAPPASTENTNWIDTSGPIDIGKTYNVATGMWEKYVPTKPLEIGAVDSADYNGNTIATLLNAPDTNVQLIAKRLNLVGAVNVLSDITGNLGTITAGKMSVLQIEGGDKQIYFGSSLTNFDGRIDYNGGAMRFQSDGSTYIKVNKGGTTGFNGTSTPTSVFQLYMANVPLFNFGMSDEGLSHRTLQGGKGRLKFLNGDTPALQARDTVDVNFIPIHASEFTVGSLRETKKNIEDYAEDALHEVTTTPVHRYHLNGDSDTELKRIGLIYDEVPADIAGITGDGVDMYSMASIMWKAIQQLNEKVDAQALEIERLKGGVAE